MRVGGTRDRPRGRAGPSGECDSRFPERRKLRHGLALTVLLIGLVSWPILSVSGTMAPGGAARHRLPARQVLIGYCDYRDVALIGTWSRRSGWRDPAARRSESVFRELLPRGGQWALYHTGRDPILVTTKAPHVSLGEHGERHYYADLIKPTGDGRDSRHRDWIAVSGEYAVDRRRLDSLPNVDDEMTRAMRRGLTEARVPVSRDARIRQNADVGLDGSGHRERLLVFAPGPQPGAALIVVGWRTAEGKLRLSIVARPGDDLLRNEFAMAQVLTVADINGDGRREVAVLWGIPDGMGVDLYEFSASGPKRVLRSVWGDA